MFKKGESGNPKGRPRASQSHQKIRQAILAAAPEIVETLIVAARAGDIRAARVLLERVVPPLKTDCAPVKIDAPSEISGRIQAVLDAMLDGEISATQAGEFLAALALAARAVPEAGDGTRALWLVPPEMPLDEWTRQAQAMART